MKRLKNNYFYLYSFLLYVVLVFVFLLLANKFIKPAADGFVLSKITSHARPSDEIIEVVVDDETVQRYNWRNDSTKDISADILDYFYSYASPKLVGLDVSYSSLRDDMYPKVKRFIEQIKKMNNLVCAFIPEYNIGGEDKRFMDDFAKVHSLDVKLSTSAPLKSKFAGIIDYSDILLKATKNYGSVLVKKDKNSDYVFNWVNVVKINDKFYPSLSLKMYLMKNNTNTIEIFDDYILVPATGLKIQYKYSDGLFETPVRFYKQIKYGDVNLSYSHNSVSAFRILDTYKALKKGITPKSNPELYNAQSVDGLIDPELFRDKVIFIGANISGPSADVLHTPIDHRHPGTDIVATVYDNLDSRMSVQNAGFQVNFLLYLLLCVPAFLIILRAKFIRGILALIGLDFIYLSAVMLFALFGYLTNYSSPLVCQFVTIVFAYSFKFLSENRNKEQIKSAMGKYISKDVMNNVVKNIDNLGLGGKRAIVTVLFSDIRGFTSMSEKMSAEDVSMILNEYFAQMEPIINKYNGVINKFIGDAIMVIFGEPIQDINHPRNAVKCAYEMLKKVSYLREKWLEEGRPKFEIGVGINTGEVFIGNIGTENRMEYTVIGDSVNLASRIEGYNKVYKTNLLISSSTYNSVSDCADVIKIKEVQIRGKSKKMDIYEVLRIDLDK